MVENYDSVFKLAAGTIQALDFTNEEVVAKCTEFLFNPVSLDAKDLTAMMEFDGDPATGVVWNDENAKRHMVFSLCFQNVFESFESVFPIYFGGKEGDGLLVQYAGENFFRLESFLTNFPDQEMGNIFLSRLRTLEGQSYADIETILSLFECYSRSHDISLAISDWAFDIETNTQILGDFSQPEKNSKLEINSYIEGLLENMVAEMRCDKLTYKTLTEAIGRSRL